VQPDATIPLQASNTHCGNGVVERGEVCDDGRNDELSGGCLPGCQKFDKSDSFFATPVVEIDIEILPADWNALRMQYQSWHTAFRGSDCRTRRVPERYTYFSATVTINGVKYTDVGLRKKSLLGSQSTLKPSLKVDLTQFVEKQQHEDVKRFALNNSVADPSYQRTCLAYAVFAKAGIPTPRCTYASVTLNGKALGIYVLVEEVKKPFLRRYFSSDSGNLYEGTISDFRPDFAGSFEQETNAEQDFSQSDLQDIYQVVSDATDETFETQLGKHVNIEQYYRFWASEVLVWHRDGYAGNSNNFFIYSSPADGGRFHFIPWGPDAAYKFETRLNYPHSIFAASTIPNRLFATAQGRKKFYSALDRLRNEIWRPEELTNTIEQTSTALKPYLQPDEVAPFDTDVQTLKTWITGRNAEIDAEYAMGDRPWTQGLKVMQCRVEVGSVTATFSTKWGTITAPVFNAGTGTLAITLQGVPIRNALVGSRMSFTTDATPRLQIVADTTDKRRFTFTASFPNPRYFEPYLTVGLHPFYAPPVVNSLGESDISQTPAVARRSFDVGEGTWTFSKVGQNNGDDIVGSFKATVYQLIEAQ